MSEMAYTNNLNLLLSQSEKTAKELASFSDLSYQKMVKIVQGDDLRLSDAMKIAAFFGKTVSEVWPMAFSVKTEQVVTEKLVLASVVESESVFA